MNHLIKSFGFALKGFRAVLYEEQNFKIEILGAVGVILFAFIFDFSFFEFSLIIFACILVLGGEILNTAIEDLCDKVEPEDDPVIGKIKDTMAAFVLVTSGGAFLIGVLIFLYHFF